MDVSFMDQHGEEVGCEAAGCRSKHPLGQTTGTLASWAGLSQSLLQNQLTLAPISLRTSPDLDLQITFCASVPLWTEPRW
ncbi:hypothetical protein P8C59_003267 [Phyllachora maydis]|uniref:Uncharacterized protein n=1 Tax=Phyllachora maydis TaxID=1825666 RepID=A0AAD9I043_9PEZI|nr:hypothetical protein P8C59_003267 [Phyllachora maydis]